jgi:hypothetical protein
MATIAPGRLHDVNNAADFIALTETNFEILTAEVFKQEPTYVSGVPTSTVGPPTSGAHVLDELWKDALGGVFKCTGAGAPGTWKQSSRHPRLRRPIRPQAQFSRGVRPGRVFLRQRTHARQWFKAQRSRRQGGGEQEVTPRNGILWCG